MVITKKIALVLAFFIGKSVDGFSVSSSMTRNIGPTSSFRTCNNKKRVGGGLCMAANGGGDDVTKITSVNSKEIYFDEKTGRFFETKLVSDEDKKSGAADVSGPFKDANPFKKPEGNFFDQFKKDGSESEPSPVSTPSPKEESAPLFGNFFQKQEEPSSKQPASVSASSAPPAPVAAKKVEESPSPFDLFENLFKSEEPEIEEPEPLYDEVTISPDFRVAALFIGSGLLLDQIPYIQFTLGPLITLLGILFLVQTFRIKFVFTENNDFLLLSGSEEDAGENVVVGGANRWACDSIVNYDFFPAIDSSPVGPILIYFKETQTPSESWSEGPGAIANSGEGKVQGQVHFFPAVCSGSEIREEFEKRGCGKL